MSYGLLFSLSCALAALIYGSYSIRWILAQPSGDVLAERWFFFAQARHPQYLYYQAIS